MITSWPWSVARLAIVVVPGPVTSGCTQTCWTTLPSPFFEFSTAMSTAWLASSRCITSFSTLVNSAGVLPGLVARSCSVRNVSKPEPPSMVAPPGEVAR